MAAVLTAEQREALNAIALGAQGDLAKAQLLEADTAALFKLRSEFSHNSVEADQAAQAAANSLTQQTRSLAALDFASHQAAGGAARLTHGTKAAKADVDATVAKRAAQLGLEASTSQLAKAAAARGLFAKPRNKPTPGENLEARHGFTK